MAKKQIFLKPVDDPKEKNWRLFFRISLFIKLFDGVLGSIVGAAILLLSKLRLTGIFVRLVRGELFEDPQDRLVHYLFNFFHTLSVANKTFAGFYILSHGLVNVIMAIGLFKEKLWAYYIAFVFLSSYVVYQIYRWSHTHSGWLALLTGFDLFFLVLAYHEYRYHKKRLTL